MKAIFSDRSPLLTYIACFLVGILLGIPLIWMYPFAQTYGFWAAVLPIIADAGLIILIFQAMTHMDLRKYSFAEHGAAFFVFLVLLMLFGSWTLVLLFKSNSLVFTFALVLLVACSSPKALSRIFAQTKDASKKFFTDYLYKEAFFTPVLALIALVMLSIYSMIKSHSLSDDLVMSILQSLVLSIGLGVVFAIIIFKSLKKHKANVWTDLGLIFGALLNYVIAEAMGGFGILAVGTFGFLFGNSFAKEDIGFISFSPFLKEIIELLRWLVFVSLGFLLMVSVSSLKIIPGMPGIYGGAFSPVTAIVLLSLVLFLVITVVRFVSLSLTSDFPVWEKIYLSLAFPKGSAVAVTLLFIILNSVSSASNTTVLAGISLLVFWSLLIAWIVQRYSTWFLTVDYQNKE